MCKIVVLHFEMRIHLLSKRFLGPWLQVKLYLHDRNRILKSSQPGFVFGPGHAKMCLMPYANNKDADQPAHPRSLISTFVVRCFIDNMICKLALSKFQVSS